MTSCMSYGLFGLSGTTSSSASSRRSRGSVPRPRGGSSTLFCGMKLKELADRGDRGRLRVVDEVRDTRRAAVRVGAAQLLHRHVFVRHRLHDVRPGDEHVRRAARHEDEIGDRRRVHRAAGARAENRRDLRHHARRERVAQENLGVPAERDDAFLDARAARVVEADHRRAVAHARSITLQIFSANDSESEPPNTVKSCENT